jgi:hypothetical protein
MKNIILIISLLTLVSCKGLLSKDAGNNSGEDGCSLADAQANGWDTTHAELPEGNKTSNDSALCSVATCGANYVKNSSTLVCDAVVCTLTNSFSHGVTDIAFATAVTGTYVTGCAITACDPGKTPSAPSGASCL